MIPKILEYEDGRVKVTAQAFAIPEIKALIDKYDMSVEPYLSFVHAMSAPDSPYINIPEEEKIETIVYDVQASLGEFDFTDGLLFIAIDKFKALYTTHLYALAEELGEELNRFRTILKSTPVIIGGENANFRDRLALMEKIDKVSTAYQKVKKQAEEESKVNTKGGHEVGEY